MRVWQILVSVSLLVASGLGILVMTGGARDLLGPGLQAELVVQDFPIPPGFGVDPDRVAAFMAKELKQRLEDDVAIRLTLKTEAVKKVKDIVLPRLMNVVVVQAMMHDIPELSAILDLGAFRRTVSGTVVSSKDAEDVSLVVPGAMLAAVDGEKVKVTTTNAGLTALELGKMKAGQSHALTLWLDESAIGVDMGRMIRLGAADGQRGRVLLWGDQGWFGEDIEALRWSRWVIGALLGGVMLFALASLLVPLLGRLQRQR